MRALSLEFRASMAAISLSSSTGTWQPLSVHSDCPHGPHAERLKAVETLDKRHEIRTQSCLHWHESVAELVEIPGVFAGLAPFDALIGELGWDCWQMS